MTTVHVEAAVTGRRSTSAPIRSLDVALPPGPTTLRNLIEGIVRAEVAAFATRSADARLVRALTQEELFAGLTGGSVRSGGRAAGANVSADDAVHTAIQAQSDGMFQTIVDERPVENLDDVVPLRDGTRVMFLRLVPLAGG
jgi:hypothetical protein